MLSSKVKEAFVIKFKQEPTGNWLLWGSNFEWMNPVSIKCIVRNKQETVVARNKVDSSTFFLLLSELFRPEPAHRILIPLDLSPSFGSRKVERYNPFPCRKCLQERRLAPNQIILIRWYDLSYTLFKASYLHNLTGVLFFPWQLLAMHESQVKCIPFNGCAIRRRKYNYVLQVESYLQPPSFPCRLSAFFWGLFRSTLRCVRLLFLRVNALLYHSKGLHSPYQGGKKYGVNNLCGSLHFFVSGTCTLWTNYCIIESKWFSRFATKLLLSSNPKK